MHASASRKARLHGLSARAAAGPPARCQPQRGGRRRRGGAERSGAVSGVPRRPMAVCARAAGVCEYAHSSSESSQHGWGGQVRPWIRFDEL